MPTAAEVDLPMPESWQAFEKMVCEAQSQRWNSSLQMNGRPGQKQNGVDIYGTDDIGRTIGIQCKKSKVPLTYEVVESEVLKADRFEGSLNTLYIATTAEPNAQLQARVRMLSETRVISGKCAVAVLFWNDVVASLLLNPKVFSLYYPNYVFSEVPNRKKERLLAALELGFFGGGLERYVDLIFGEYSHFANDDPDELIAKLRTLKHHVEQLLLPEDAAPILDALDFVSNGCTNTTGDGPPLGTIMAYAKRVSKRLKSAVFLLSGVESDALAVALQLGHIWHYVNDLPKPDTRNNVEKMVRRVLPEECASAIKKAFSTAKKATCGDQWADHVYAMLLRQTRMTS